MLSIAFNFEKNVKIFEIFEIFLNSLNCILSVLLCFFVINKFYFGILVFLYPNKTSNQYSNGIPQEPKYRCPLVLMTSIIKLLHNWQLTLDLFDEFLNLLLVLLHCVHQRNQFFRSWSDEILHCVFVFGITMSCCKHDKMEFHFRRKVL